MSQAKLLPSSETREPLTAVREVFASLAEELERARVLGLRVEGAICAIAVRSSIDGGIVGELQHLDADLAAHRRVARLRRRNRRVIATQLPALQRSRRSSA